MEDKSHSPRILYWCESTAGLPITTGIQRVVRRLGSALEALGLQITPVGWDGGRQVIRVLSQDERDYLGFGLGTAASLTEAGRHAEDRWLLLPETFFGASRSWLKGIASAYRLKTAAIVHDLIPIKLTTLYPPTVTAAYTAYFEALVQADLVITTTVLVASDFRAFCEARRLPVPSTAVVSLAGSGFGPRPDIRRTITDGEPLRVLSVASWEARKNHPRLLDGLRMAQAKGGRAIKLTLVGHRGFDPAYDQSVLARSATMPDVSIKNGVSDVELARLYATHHATVYASYEEGFGLPVLESLWFGLPCLCHNGSAMREVAPGGGTMAVNMLDKTSIADGLSCFANSPGVLGRLSREAIERPVRTWGAMASELASVLQNAFDLPG